MATLLAALADRRGRLEFSSCESELQIAQAPRRHASQTLTLPNRKTSNDEADKASRVVRSNFVVEFSHRLQPK